MKTWVDDTEVSEFRRRRYVRDPKTFGADAYWIKNDRYAVAWDVLGWETESDDETEWSGIEQKTGKVLVVMVGDDQVFTFDPDELVAIDEKAYCAECGQIGCTADGREH